MRQKKGAIAPSIIRMRAEIEKGYSYTVGWHMLQLSVTKNKIYNPYLLGVGLYQFTWLPSIS